MLRILLFIFYFVCSPVNAEEWVWPSLPTTEAKSGTVEVVENFIYTEQKVSGNGILVLDEKNYSDELLKLLARRFQSIKNLDYARWLTTWSESGLREFNQLNSDKGYTPELWVKGWKEQYSNAEFILKRKINYNEYNIITYSVRYITTGKTLDFEFPVVLEYDGKYGVSAKLKANPLVIHSPWIKGIKEKRVKSVLR